MQWLKSLVTFKVGSRTFAMTAIATALKLIMVYMANHGIVFDAYIMDGILYLYTAALGGALVFARKAIENIGKK